MNLESVHDCEESAKADADARNAEVESQKEQARELYRKAWEFIGKPVPAREMDLMNVYRESPEQLKPKVERILSGKTNVLYPYDAPEYSVHGPFDVVPWKVVKP
jgi:hypothetical protein